MFFVLLHLHLFGIFYLFSLGEFASWCRGGDCGDDVEICELVELLLAVVQELIVLASFSVLVVLLLLFGLELDNGGVTRAEGDGIDCWAPKFDAPPNEPNIEGCVWLGELLDGLQAPVAAWLLLACNAAAIAAILPLKLTNAWLAGMPEKGNGPGPNGREVSRIFSISASFSLCKWETRCDWMVTL